MTRFSRAATGPFMIFGMNEGVDGSFIVHESSGEEAAVRYYLHAALSEIADIRERQDLTDVHHVYANLVALIDATHINSIVEIRPALFASIDKLKLKIGSRLDQIAFVGIHPMVTQEATIRMLHPNATIRLIGALEEFTESDPRSICLNLNGAWDEFSSTEDFVGWLSRFPAAINKISFSVSGQEQQVLVYGQTRLLCCYSEFIDRMKGLGYEISLLTARTVTLHEVNFIEVHLITLERSLFESSGTGSQVQGTYGDPSRLASGTLTDIPEALWLQEFHLPSPRREILPSFFGTLRHPYYIYAKDFRQSSAGIRALHYLCHALNELGEEAYLVNTKAFSPTLRTPSLSIDRISDHFAAGRIPIAVYPEVIIGNPLGMPVVARWLLNKAGHLGGSNSLSGNELAFAFDQWVHAESGELHRLTTPTVDTNIFNNDRNDLNDSRSGYCYYANKYLAFGGTLDRHLTEFSVSLCHDIPRSAGEIAAILRKSEALFCYEQSSIITEALLCGCPVVIVATDYWEQSKWPDDYLPAGVTVIERHAISSVDKRIISRLRAELVRSKQAYEAHVVSCWQTIENFVQLTQDAAVSFSKNTRNQPATLLPTCAADAESIWSIPAIQREKFLNVFHKSSPAIALLRGNNHKEIAQSEGPIESQPGIHFGACEISLFEDRVRQWSNHPTFHLIIIEDNMPDAALGRTLQSLAQQIYPKVIATIVAARPSPFELGSGRLEWRTTQDNQWFFSNEVIRHSPAEWCGVIRAGDTVSATAFLLVGEYLNQHTECQMLYCDEEISGSNGSPTRHHLKPDFNLEQLRAQAYIGSLLLARRELWVSAGGWSPLPRGIDELDVALRLVDVCGSACVGHVSGVLFQRDDSDSAVQPDTPERQALRVHVVQEHLNRRGINAVAEDGLLPGLVHVRYTPKHLPLVSVIIPTRNRAGMLDACLRSLVDPTEYPAFEVIVVDNDSDDAATRTYLDGLDQLGSDQIRVLSYKGSYNLGAIYNFAAMHARGELLLLMHDDVTAMHRDWLSNMASICIQDGVGAVGSRLLQPNGTLQQNWLIPLKAGITSAPFHNWPLELPEVQYHLSADQEVPAVGHACMLVRKAAFDAVGGFDTERFGKYFADIDLCLSLRNANYKVLWTPFATLVHDSDNSTWGDKGANNDLLEKWGKTLVLDPLVNPYWSIGSEIIKPETDPAFLPDVISWHPVPNVYGMSSDMEGAGHYRVIQPVQGATASCLARGRIARGYPVPVILEKLDIDVIFSQRQVEDQQLKNLARYRKLLDCRIVMDFDDLVTKVPEKSIHKKTVHKDMKSRLRQLGEIAHRFTVSTEPLAQEFRQYHDDVRVIPNALFRPLWENLKSERSTSAKPRVGWAGGVSHQGDLEIIRDVVRETANEVDWIFMGMWLKELAPYIKEVHDGVKFADYPAKLASLNLDLAVAPLEINHFNECKSHLRILEYGILGLPVIATDIHPYRGDFPITLIKNNKHQEWIKALRNHINDLDETRRRGDALREHVLNHWMLDQHLDAWLKAWTE